MLINTHSLFNSDHTRDLESIINNLISIMENHYGPNSKFAVLNSVSDKLQDPVFTTDGFNIFRNIESDDVHEYFIIKIITYIADRVAKNVGDGTTTAILFSLYLIKYFIDSPKFRDLFTTTSFHTIKKTSIKIMKEIEDALKSDSLTVDKIKSMFNDEISTKDIIEKLAYSQAYTASRGDEELSLVIAEFFSMLPTESLDSVYFEQHETEKDKRVYIHIEDNDYECKSDILSTGMMNMESGTRFESPSSTIVFNYVGLTLNDINFNKVFELIRTSFVDNKNLVIITPSACGATRTEIHALIKQLKLENAEAGRPDPAFGIFFIDTNSDPINDILIMSVIATEEQVSMYALHTVEDVDVYFEGSILKLNNLNKVKHPEGQDIATRPQFKNPQYPIYNTLMTDMEEALKKLRSYENVNGNVGHKISKLIKLKNRLLLNKRIKLEIGGGSYENKYLFDVVEDCLKGTIRSIKEGFVFGNLYTTKKVIHAILNQYINEDNNLCITILRSFMDVIYQINPNTNDELTEEISGNRFYPYALESWSNKETVFIIQPVKTDIEVIRRVEEVIFKLLASSNLITLK